MAALAFASPVATFPALSEIKPALTSIVSSPPEAPNPTVAANASLAADVRVIVIVVSLVMTAVSTSLAAIVTSAVVDPSPFTSQTNFAPAKSSCDLTLAPLATPIPEVPSKPEPFSVNTPLVAL